MKKQQKIFLNIIIFLMLAEFIDTASGQWMDPPMPSYSYWPFIKDLIQFVFALDTENFKLSESNISEVLDNCGGATLQPSSDAAPSGSYSVVVCPNASFLDPTNKGSVTPSMTDPYYPAKLSIQAGATFNSTFLDCLCQGFQQNMEAESDHNASIYKVGLGIVLTLAFCCCCYHVAGTIRNNCDFFPKIPSIKIFSRKNKENNKGNEGNENTPLITQHTV